MSKPSISIDANEAQSIRASQDALSVHDLIGDHPTPNNYGGYLNFTVNDGVVTLGLSLNAPDNVGNAAHLTLATIEGASGLSNAQILNTLLSHHEISFD